jgi:hypothetical protein
VYLVSSFTHRLLINGFYNRDEVCLLRGTGCKFIYNSGESWGLTFDSGRRHVRLLENEGVKGQGFPRLIFFPHENYSFIAPYSPLSTYFSIHTNKSSKPGNITKISVILEMREHWTENFCHLTSEGLKLQILMCTAVICKYFQDDQGSYARFIVFCCVGL